MSWIRDKWEEHKQNRNREKTRKAEQRKEEEYQAGIEEIRHLTERVSQFDKETDRKEYQEIMAKKDDLKAKAGLSGEAAVAMDQLETALRDAEGEIRKAEEDGKRSRQNAKKEKYIKIIASQKGTPLEKLIGKVENLSAGGVMPEPRNTKYDPSQGTRKRDVFKQKLKLAGTSARRAFSNWRTALAAVAGVMVAQVGAIMPISTDVTALGADGKDIQDMKGVMEEINEYDTSGAGITAAAVSGVVAIVQTIQFVHAMVKEGRKDFGAGKVSRDHQERWKLARTYMHQVVEILTGFQGAFGPLSKAIPFFNSIAALCTGGANMIVDAMDIVSSSIHLESMRKERNRIYQRIEEKKLKYSKHGKSEDDDAKLAYTVESGRFHRSRKVEKKRVELMKDVQRMDAANAPLVTSDKLRSRNDSEFRNAQYGLGKRIKNAGDKSKKRQMEAFQMMEEYREADKAHKKMSKMLGHNIENVIKGGASLVANGLKLAGEISAATGAGLGLYAGGMATGMGVGAYNIGRHVGSMGYKSLRIAAGTEDNKATTREDMAISLINKMQDITGSAIWNHGSAGGGELKSAGDLDSSVDYKEIVVGGRNVEHLDKIFRDGLDVTMSDLLKAKNMRDLKSKIAGNFAQG